MDSCVKILYTKKNKFATKIAYVQNKILPQPQNLYTGMPVTPVTNSISAHKWTAYKETGLSDIFT